MASVNKCIFIGNVTADPSVRYMPNSEAVANFSIACNESWKDKSGIKQEKTEFVNIVMYRKLAELAGEYLKKGSPVYIEGRLQTRKWEKDGVTRYSTEIIGDNMQFLGSKSAQSSEGDSDTQAPQNKASDGAKMASGGYEDQIDFDSSIPY